jgi:hypothetical protein
MNASIRRTKQEMEACCLVEVPRAMNICYGAYADIGCSGGFTSEGEYVPVTVDGAPNWLINGRIFRYIDSMNAFYEKVIEYKHVLLKPQANWMHMHTQICECINKCNDYSLNVIQLWTPIVLGVELGIRIDLKRFKKSNNLLVICNELRRQFIDRKPLIVIQKKEKGCKKGKGKNSLDTCAICRETQSELVLNCTHAYCNECIQTWAKTCESKSTPITCPYCRAVVQHAVKI